MKNIPVEDLLKHTNNSIYKLVILASRRAQELGAGAEKLIAAEPNTKVTTIALREIKEDKIGIKPAKNKHEGS